MKITEQIEAMRVDKLLQQQIDSVQNLTALQAQYHSFLQQGLTKKRGYNLAPVNILGASLPGQTTYKVTLG